ncbi:MAG: transcriptional regulator [Nitrospirae bacterium]|nr:MAG: transcriptional regulator [Nitrospirota bacterium]
MDEHTPRQRIRALLCEGDWSTRDLAQCVGISERQVEEHLQHIARSLARNHTQHLLVLPSRCVHCGFTFRDRKKLTKPSRCPRCRSEMIAPPRYTIRERDNKQR